MHSAMTALLNATQVVPIRSPVSWPRPRRQNYFLKRRMRARDKQGDSGIVTRAAMWPARVCARGLLCWGDKSHLSVLLHYVLEYASVGRLAKAALNPRLLIILVSGAESLWAEVKGVAKWLVDALEGITTSHEDLVLELVK